MRDARLRDVRIPGGRLDLLSPSDAVAVFDLYQRCQDYFRLQDGEPAVRSDADELFNEVPPSKRPEDQFVIGYRRDTRLLGVAQLLTNYPNEWDWYLGFLLLDPGVRGAGVGRHFYKAVEQWSAGQGAKRMLLCVLDANEPALRFWRSLDFELVRAVDATTFKQKSHVRYEFARQL